MNLLHTNYIKQQLARYQFYLNESVKARSDRARRRVSTRPIKLMLKIGSIHTERVERASTRVN